VSQQQVPPRAVLDSDIIFSRVLHELMGRVATRLRVFDLFWSDQLLTEAKASLIRRKGLSDEVAQRWVDYLRESLSSLKERLMSRAPDRFFVRLGCGPQGRWGSPGRVEVAGRSRGGRRPSENRSEAEARSDR
jgi:hypothetical protein